MSIETFVLIALTGMLGFVGWTIRGRLTQIDDLASRVTVLETKLDVLGDISETLHQLRTSVEIIKTKLQLQEDSK